VCKGDTEIAADRLLERIVGYRIFPDGEARMNLSLKDIDGELLLVPQFTLAADTDSGMRAGFSSAAVPDEGRKLFDYLAARARGSLKTVATGTFGAHMQVSLVNDGPVTFWLETPPAKPA
jgi:D-tyrosyl-tRNA(Tyr) deacylase